MTFHSGTYLGQHPTPRRTEMSDMMLFGVLQMPYEMAMTAVCNAVAS